jgi:hypothetical protein
MDASIFVAYAQKCLHLGFLLCISHCVFEPSTAQDWKVHAAVQVVLAGMTSQRSYPGPVPAVTDRQERWGFL